MARKLISLNFRPSDDAPELGDLKTFLATEFNRHIDGFRAVETDAKWGDSTIHVVGKDAHGGLVGVLASVSRRERDYRDVISDAVLASTWLEDNRDEARQRYGDVDLGRPLRILLVAPSQMTPSRSLSRALERAGVEVMPYSIFDIDTSDGVLRAVSFGASNAPPAARPVSAAPVSVSAAPQMEAAPRVEPVPEPAEAPPAEAAEPPASSRGERRPSAVDNFISSLMDPNLRAMSEQIVTFLLSRFPTADGTVQGDRGFTLAVGQEHLATIRLDRNSLWLEVGPEKIPTNKIKDPATLDRAMNLPSVLEALHSVQSS